jgi:PST family polysaccharide transporter
MTLLKTSFLNGIAVAVKVGSALVLNKILAVYVGPSGYAVIGQFQNAISILTSLAGGLVSSGVTKNTAQHFDDVAKQHRIWQTALRFSLIASLIAGVAVLLLGGQLSKWLLHRNDMGSLFGWLALTLPAIAANTLLLAIVNGKKEIGIYVTANITGSILAIIVTGGLAYGFGLYGALLAFIINPAIVLLVTAMLVSRREWFNANFLWGKMDRSSAKALSGFAMMSITSAMVMPATYMLIRDHIATTLGLEAAGYWQASWKISEIYLMLITTTLTVYYLPRLAEIRSAGEIRREIAKVYRFALPIAVIGAVSILVLRDPLIRLLFTEDFLPMRELFPWQLAGDVIKIGSWVLGYILIGRAMTKYFILTEIVFSAFFVLLSWWLVGSYGLVGVPMAYVLNYTLHWAAMASLALKEIARMEP